MLWEVIASHVAPDSDTPALLPQLYQASWLHFCPSAHVKFFEIIISTASLCTNEDLRSPAEGSSGALEYLALCQISYLK